MWRLLKEHPGEKTHISLTWRLLRENPNIADVAVIEGTSRGKTHISLTWRLLSTVSMNERANQSGFSTLSVNGIKSCDSSILVS